MSDRYRSSYENLPIPEDQRARFLPDVRPDDTAFHRNPTRVDKPFWKYMVSHGSAQAWDARNVLGIELSRERPWRQPIFCFNRFGRTETKLPDGRIVYIGGEHEDSYDPDFNIYNDVVVVRRRDRDEAGQGTLETDADTDADSHSDMSDSDKSYPEWIKAEKIKDDLNWAASAAGADPADIDIYGYPTDDFPPTDFHTATYFKDESDGGKEYIYIIGGLGYGEGPHSEATQVYRLDLQGYSIQRVETAGDVPPRRVGTERKFKAELQGDRIMYTVESAEYVLSLADMRWSNVSAGIDPGLKGTERSHYPVS